MKYRDVPFLPYHKGYETRKTPAYFIAWDGEGITETEGTPQNYVLFGNSRGYSVKSSRLTTDECLRLIIATEIDHPKAIHVGYAFSYDAEMILADLPPERMKILKNKGYVTWRSYRIEYRKSKWLQITLLAEKRVTARIWDVFSFFHSPFVTALEEYLGDVPMLAAVKEGKQARGRFTYEMIEEFIRPYWELELKYLVELMDSLRERLISADLPIKQWHGPGAIATYAMRKYGVENSLDREVPESVNDAAQFAYSGGRFELFRMGRANSKVYAYDIRSAYPSAIRELPNLANGEWEYVSNPRTISHFGVYHIRFRHPSLFTLRPLPLFFRDSRHAIHYPNVVEGWYWSPEAQVCLAMNGAEILEGYEFLEDGARPFEWVNEVYETRAQWKAEGNPAQIALKLLLNSMYGKFAQRVGWEHTKEKGAPKWHQLEYAGWVTSHARAKIFRAMVQAWSTDSLLGVETDGIFTTSPLILDVGPSLGQWEESVYDDMIYLQSGFYHLLSGNDWKDKTRGFDRDSVGINKTLQAITEWEPWEGKSGFITGETTRFPTMGQWLRTQKNMRNVWTTSERKLALGSDGKRIHRPEVCRACQERQSLADALHDLTVTYPQGGISKKHVLPWLTKEVNPFRDYEEFDYNG